ncbi:hypothetical protein [Nocardia fluminea]|uniref:hypothetical protein n=1 Tax=Nocardia fluminea TaxID=134984 RepID=UPI003669A7E1
MPSDEDLARRLDIVEQLAREHDLYVIPAAALGGKVIALSERFRVTDFIELAVKVNALAIYTLENGTVGFISDGHIHTLSA